MSLELSATVTSRDVQADLAIASGETVALLGPNGAGKSTLLAVAAGLLRPEAGRVLLDGRPVLDTTRGLDVAPHQRGVALLAQDPLLFPHLSVRENVAFGPRSKGSDRRAARAAADTWLARVGIGDLAERRPSEVSGGQAQRAAVARALAAEPRLLLLDEPLAALDVAVAPALRQVLRDVLAERTTLLVTHDPLDALLLADRVVVLESGRVVESGSTREVLARPRSAFAAQLAGLNMLTGTWAGDHVVLPGGARVHGLAVGPHPSSGEPVVATFRPGSVAIYTGASTGSPRNSFAVIAGDLEPRGDLIRVRAQAPWEGLCADVTVSAVADLDLVPGTSALFTVKATEVSVYRL